MFVQNASQTFSRIFMGFISLAPKIIRVNCITEPALKQIFYLMAYLGGIVTLCLIELQPSTQVTEFGNLRDFRRKRFLDASNFLMCSNKYSREFCQRHANISSNRIFSIIGIFLAAYVICKKRYSFSRVVFFQSKVTVLFKNK